MWQWIRPSPRNLRFWQGGMSAPGRPKRESFARRAKKV
jgi:hypothetical protein